MLCMYEKILLPTDGSKESEAAVKHAEELAEKFGAEIHILYVVDITQGARDPAFQTRLENLKELGNEDVQELEDKIEIGDIKTSVQIGVPYKEINKYVKDEDIDIVTMGSHGHSGLERFLLGSVTEKVLRTCSTPVLTAKIEEG